MTKKMTVWTSVVLGIVIIVSTGLQAQEGIGERIGRTVDRGLSELGEEVREGWAEVRNSVDRLGTQGRVYSRLRWDKATTSASIDVQVEDKDRVVLAGTVPNEAAHKKAVELAKDTVGVREVVDRLRVARAKR